MTTNFRLNDLNALRRVIQPCGDDDGSVSRKPTNTTENRVVMLLRIIRDLVGYWN